MFSLIRNKLRCNFSFSLSIKLFTKKIVSAFKSQIVEGNVDKNSFGWKITIFFCLKMPFYNMCTFQEVLIKIYIKRREVLTR